MASQENAAPNSRDKKIDAEKIKHIAHLARIGINDAEAEQYAGQMNSILDYMKILEEVNTDGVEMTMQVTGLKNVTRADQPVMEESADSLLAATALPKISNQIAVRAVIKEE